MGFNEGFNQYGPGGSLQRLQHQVNQQPQMIPPYVNGSSPSKLIHEGPGFDPFQRDNPEKKDEISYDWVSFQRRSYICKRPLRLKGQLISKALFCYP